MLFPIQQRKIGPGLKAGLKFALFANHNNLEIQFKPTGIIETHIPKLAFDAELFMLIMDHLNVQHSTKARFTNAYLTKNLESVGVIDAAYLIMSCSRELPSGSKTILYRKAISLIYADVIDKRFDDRLLNRLLTSIVYENSNAKLAPIIDIMEFTKRNIKDQKVKSDTLVQCINAQSFRSVGSWGKQYSPDLPEINKYVLDLYTSKDIDQSVLHNYVYRHLGLMKMVEEGGRIFVTPKTEEDSR